MPIDKIIKDIQVAELMRFPLQKKRKFPPIDKSKCYKFHRDYRHDTNECIKLKDKIEMLLRRGKLVKYKCYGDRGMEREKVGERQCSGSLRLGEMSTKT